MLPTPPFFRSSPPARRFIRHPARGSVLIVALLISALIAVSLASYLSLNLSSTRLAKRSFDGYAALNLAEAGTEEGVWSFNRAAASDSAAWTGWTGNGSASWKKFPDFNFGSNTTGWVKVYIDNVSPPPGTNPKVIAQSSVSAPGSAAVQRMIEVTLRRRSHFANGLVSKESVVFNGTDATVDSWNSDPDHDPSTAPVDFSSAVRNDRGSVASVSVINTAVAINQADVWGYVATGGAAPEVGSGGTVRGADTATGVKVDPRRVSTDFNADFPLVTAPTDGTTLTTLGATLGVPGLTTRWRTPSISLSGNETLTILGNVILVLTSGTGAPAISVTGNAVLSIPAGSTLTVYVDGNVLIAGKGLANGNTQPVSCQIWGTNTSLGGQDIQIAGNGALRVVLYAPNGDVRLNGNGDMMGSVVARNITLVGNAAFHYDESLAEFGTTTPFGIAKWRELTTADDRARYQGLFEGW
jgi:hypothetical protein